ARRSNLRYGSSQSMALALFEVWNAGWTPAALDDYPQHLASVTVSDLAAALEVCRASAVISVLDSTNDRSPPAP
ncbi:MAG: hypothetical protein ABUL67_02485, partial [Haliangium ochraceum]